MRTIRCNKCRSMYEYEGMPPPACPECMKELYWQLQVVRELVKGCKGITVNEVHLQTGIPVPTIMGFIASGDIETLPG